MAVRPHIRGYELLEPIGTGAESVIYRAREVSNGSIVAIKDVLVEDPEKLKYLRHVVSEYQTLRRLQNRETGTSPLGIVNVHRLIRSGFMRRKKRYALVMEYIQGYDLRRERRYPFGQIIDILAQVADSISALHSRNIVHGDLKPENIIVNPAGKATIVDFGFSCIAGSMARSIRGTRDYMAPEQVDMGHITEKTDIYNFGATMYFLLTERHVPALIPAAGDSSLFIASEFAGPKSPRSLNPNVPPHLSGMVLQCVKKESHERPSCIEEVKAVLGDVRKEYIA